MRERKERKLKEIKITNMFIHVFFSLFKKKTDIVDCEPRPIMGLIWALIYQFSIRSQTLLEQQCKKKKKKN